jgi:hypothetical protein
MASFREEKNVLVNGEASREAYGEYVSVLPLSNIQHVPVCKINTSPSFRGEHYKLKVKSNNLAYSKCWSY